MGSLNTVTLIGNLGRDAELRFTPGGAAVTTFSIACTEVWSDKQGQRQERTEWIRVVLWGKSAEALAEYLTRGKQVCVVGKIQTRQWEKDGQKHYTTEIRGDKVVLLGGGGGRPRDEHVDDHAMGAAMGTSAPATDLADEDIPF